MFLFVPAERHRSRAGVRREDRPGLVDPVLDAVVALLDPLAEEPRAVGHVRMEDRGMDARPRLRARLDELLESGHPAFARADALDRLGLPVADVEDRLHREQRPE